LLSVLPPLCQGRRSKSLLLLLKARARRVVGTTSLRSLGRRL
jgi:hypothetical protein